MVQFFGALAMLSSSFSIEALSFETEGLLISLLTPFLISTVFPILYRKHIDVLAQSERDEEALSENEGFANQIAELSPVVINVFDLATRRDVYISPDVVNLLGYTPKEIAAMDDPFSALWHPEDVTLAREHLTRLRSAADGAISELEYRIRHRDGEWRWMSTRGTPFARDEHGAVREIVTATVDITDRKQAEDAQRSQKEIPQKIFDHIPAMISFFDAEGRIQLVNREWERWRGWSLEEILSEKVDLLTEGYPDPDYRQQAITLAANSNGNPFSIKTKVRDGRVLDTAWSVVHLSDGTRIGLGQDITERKQTEEALKESRRYLQALFDNSLDAILVTNDEGRYIDANPAACELLGYTHEELIQLSVLDLTAEPFRHEGWAMWKQFLAKGSQSGEYSTLRKDGTVLQLEFRAVANILPGLHLSSSRDITERRRAEDAQREAEQKYRDIFENALEGIFQIRPDGGYISSNPALARMLGFNCPEELIRERSDHSKRRYVDPRRRQEYIQLLSEEGAVRDFEYEDYRADGSIIWFSDNVHAVRDPDGTLLYYEGTTQDITERKWVELAQRESQQQYETLVHSIDGIVWEVDAQTFTFTFVSKQAERILGYPLEQWFEGPSFWPDHMHPDDRDWAVAFCVDATERRVDHQFEYRMIAADGHVIWLSDIVTVLVADDQSVLLRGVMVDITERKLIEEKLKQSESLLGEAQHLANLGSWNRNLENNTLSWSHELYHIFGVQPSEFDPSYEAVMGFTHPQDRDLLRRVVESALKTHEPFSFHYRITRPDGEERIIHSRGNTISDISGTPIRMHGTAQDVTERKQAEDAAREAERKYRDIFENAGEGIFQSTPDGRYIAANPTLARMYGFASPEELIQSRQDISRQVYVDPTRRDEFKRQLEEHGAIRGFDYQAFRKDGSKFWISVNARAVRDEQGEIQYYEGTAQDITERKRAEDLLRESEERYRELFENAKDVTYVHDLNGRYMSVNRATEKLTGYSKSEILGKNFTHFVPPEQIGNIREQLCRKLADEGETSYESEVITKDGRRVAVEVNSHVILENGVPIAVQGTARDITERKAAEERLTANSAQLRALSARLQSAREEEGTRIAREIHDELGSVLTSLKWDLEGTDKIFASPMEPSQVAALRERFQDLMKLTDLAISATRRIASELRPSILDDLGLVAAIEWQAQQFQARTGIVCVCDCSLEVLELRAQQSTALFRILQEALTNVLRHAQATRVDIELSIENGSFVLSVSDNGKGITENAESEQQSLGILGMRERAHLIGGEIDIKGMEGKGTVVIVRVPISGDDRVLKMTS